MAISRMQQPRQMYGLGSFVKKLTRKVTRPFTKVAKKIVPKEIAGIMRIAAPFLGPVAGPAAYLLGTARQTGRISPVDLALAAAPSIGRMKLPEQGRLSKFVPEGLQGRRIKSVIGDIEVPFTKSAASGEKSIRELLVGLGDTSGIFGGGGKMFKIGQADGPSLLETKAGQTLFGKPEMVDGKATGKFVPSFTKIGSIGVGLLSFLRDAKTPEEAGNALVAQTGNSDDYAAGFELFSRLDSENFRVPERFRLPVPAANGGLMRTNYALGSDDNPNAEPINPFKPKPIGPVLPEEDKPFTPRPLKPLKMSEDDDKGIMMMAGSDRYQRILEKLINELEDQLGRELTDAEYDMAGRMAYERLSDPDFAVGGRVDYALGTKPTAEESGLGGLPIEADMRYTGGFMPYGAKEKADDVPARLSKNEFVFTADAVRAAGGGSVNKGAKKMYQTMKQLEAKPEAKGMIA